MHKAYSKTTREHFEDRFNIDFIRFFRNRNFMWNMIGSVIGSLFFITGWNRYFSMNRELIIPLYFGGMLLFLLILSIIVHKAVGKWIQAFKITARRGLFTYTIMTLVVITMLIVSKEITLSDTFGRFLYTLLSMQISAALFAVPLDLGSTFSRKQ